MTEIIHISEAASLALHSMAILALSDNQSFSNVRQLAQQTGTSEAHLAKVMQRLVKVGLVHSNRGPSGGFSLAKAAEDIRLLDIYETIEGPLMDKGCLLHKENCLLNRCLFDGLLQKLTREVIEYLAGLTLADLARSGKGFGIIEKE